MVPNWDDPKLKAGTMVRTALWLVAEVGVGNVFTKEQHREAFKGIAQADRRLRDLRKYGWIIHTSLQDVSLNSNEQRLVAVGQPVWDSKYRRVSETITAKLRHSVFAKSNYQCAICGIAGGERYPDAPHITAVLTARRVEVQVKERGVRTALVCECTRCAAGGTRPNIDVPAFLNRLLTQPKGARELFLLWSQHGRSQLDGLWTEFRRMPDEAKEQIKDALAEASRNSS
jgi:hypothetical protein